jgi:hypothetical protein
MKDHKDDYYKLSKDSVSSEVPLSESYIYIYLDDDEVVSNNEYKNGCFSDKIEVIDSKTMESYRELLNADANQTAVIWYHDYANTQVYTWEKIKDFDLKKIKVYTFTRIDETDSSNYLLISEIRYDETKADDSEFYGSPKMGYSGPYII